jgi:hypothetical protein
MHKEDSSVGCIDRNIRKINQWSRKAMENEMIDD